MLGVGKFGKKNEQEEFKVFGYYLSVKKKRIWSSFGIKK
jgi:hypothetical protein